MGRNNGMENPKYFNLLRKRKQGALSAEEAARMDEFSKNTDPDAIREMEKLWELSGKYKAGYEPDTKKGWEKLQKRGRRDHPRRGASHARPLGLWFLVVLLLALLFLLLYYYYQSAGAADPVADADKVHITNPGERAALLLPDSSLVTLNEKSHLAVQYGEGRRLVQLTGEGYFQVRKDSLRPFIIRTNTDTEVRVLGTAFNLRAYPNEKMTEVEVDTGVVDFMDLNNGNSTVIESHQRGVCERQGRMYREALTVRVNDLWMKGEVRFDNTPLRRVALILERYYGINLDISRTPAKTCPISHLVEDSSSTSIDSLLQIIKSTVGGEIESPSRQTFSIVGGQPCNE